MDPCQDCGACCSYSADWPIFTTECDSELDLIPASLVSDDLRGMRCIGNRCSALTGEVGGEARCSIYGLRPDVCRVCQPGDHACSTARLQFGLPPFG